jgi:hypothetical protein
MEIDASSINYTAPHTQVTRPFSDSCHREGRQGRWAHVWRSGEVSGDSRAAPCDLHAGFHVEARSFRYAVVLEHAHQRLAQQIEISRWAVPRTRLCPKARKSTRKVYRPPTFRLAHPATDRKQKGMASSLALQASSTTMSPRSWRTGTKSADRTRPIRTPRRSCSRSPMILPKRKSRLWPPM